MAPPSASGPEQPSTPPVPDNIVVLHGATWGDYQRLLEIRGERLVPRLTYLNGVLQLMSPSQPHESIKCMIGRLLEAFCMEKGVEITAHGVWTLERKEEQRGIEPDECYVLGDDPATAACCDLAIDVEWTSGIVDKLDVYRKLGVREVWIWRAGRLHVFGLRGATYETMPASALLPGIDLDLLLSFVGVRPMTRAVREYRDRLGAAAVAAR